MVKVLILSIAPGTSSEKAGRAVKERLEKGINPPCVEIANILKDIESIGNNPMEETLLNLMNTIYKFTPHVIVSTHPLHLEMLSGFVGTKGFDASVVSLVTGFTPSHIGNHLFVEAYIIPHEDLSSHLVDTGIPGNMIFPFGIPVMSEFLKASDRQQALGEFGLEDKPTVLIIGGGLDTVPLRGIFKSLAFSSMDIQIITVAGNNTRLKNQLQCIGAACSKATKTFGCTDRVPELMTLSSLLITKPSSLTISEAFIRKVPLVLASPMAGPEKKISDYLINKGAAAAADEKTCAHIIQSLLNTPEKLQQMKLESERMAKPNAAADTASFIMSLSNKNNPMRAEGPKSEL